MNEDMDRQGGDGLTDDIGSLGRAADDARRIAKRGSDAARRAAPSTPPPNAATPAASAGGAAAGGSSGAAGTPAAASTAAGSTPAAAGTSAAAAGGAEVGGAAAAGGAEAGGATAAGGAAGGVAIGTVLLIALAVVLVLLMLIGLFVLIPSAISNGLLHQNDPAALSGEIEIFDFGDYDENKTLIGNLPNFEKVLATARSADMSFSIIFQNLPQLENAYPDGLWTSIIGDCFTFICLSCNDMETAKYLSERSGTATVALQQTRVNRPLFELLNVPNSIQYSYSVGQRAVLQPAEIITLSKTNKILISIAGADLFLCDKFPYTEMIDPSTLTILDLKDHTPMWVVQRTNESTDTTAQPSATDFWAKGDTPYQQKYVAPKQPELAGEAEQDKPPGDGTSQDPPQGKTPTNMSNLSPDSVDCQEF